MRRRGLAIAVTATLLTACSKAREPRSYDFFKVHPTERTEVVRKCRHGAGDYQYEPQAECSPAFNAQLRAEREHDMSLLK